MTQITAHNEPSFDYVLKLSVGVLVFYAPTLEAAKNVFDIDVQMAIDRITRSNWNARPAPRAESRSAISVQAVTDYSTRSASIYVSGAPTKAQAGHIRVGRGPVQFSTVGCRGDDTDSTHGSDHTTVRVAP